MDKNRLSVWWVLYSYRRQKKFKTERWKPRYRWHSETVLIVCTHRYEVEGLIDKHLTSTAEGECLLEYQIKEVSRVKLPKDIKGGAE